MRRKDISLDGCTLLLGEVKRSLTEEEKAEHRRLLARIRVAPVNPDLCRTPEDLAREELVRGPRRPDDPVWDGVESYGDAHRRRMAWIESLPI